jgi:hypothetical protein
LVIILILVAAFAYLNQVGLPGFVKKPLLENLRARGLDVQFSRLRCRWYRGLVADNVRFERADEALSPQFTLQEVQVRLNHHALSRLHIQIDGLVLRQGRLVWPIPETNQAPRQLAIDNIQTELRFLPNDEWALDNFTSTFAGADIRLSGMITNASAIRDCPPPPGFGRIACAGWRIRSKASISPLRLIWRWTCGATRVIS